jgi:uncharacterized protein with PQ loop repeat
MNKQNKNTDTISCIAVLIIPVLFSAFQIYGHMIDDKKDFYVSAIGSCVLFLIGSFVVPHVKLETFVKAFVFLKSRIQNPLNQKKEKIYENI